MASVDVGSETYPSFVSVDDADIYLDADVLRAEPWAAITDPDMKGRGLASATRMLLSLPWVAPAPTPDDDPVPAIIQEVTAMLAADLLAKPKLFADASGNSNIKSVKAEGTGVEFFRPVEGQPAIPRLYWDMLAAAGLVGVITSGDVIAGATVSGIHGSCRPLYGRPAWDYPVACEDHD